MDEKRLAARLEWIKRHPEVTLKHDKLQRKASHDYRGFKIGCNRAVRRLSARAEAVPQPTATTVTAKQLSLPLWEQGYHDRILRNKGQLQNMINYVHDNPRRLWIKRQHPDFFTSHSQQTIAGTAATTIGNLFLLNFPLKVQVQCSRKLTEAQIEDKWKEILDLAELGYVIVTPGISPGEKTIMTRAIDAGYPIIMPTKRKYTSKEKPQGKLFDACANGNLLLVSPQLKDTQKELTGAQCWELNDLARAICGT